MMSDFISKDFIPFSSALYRDLDDKIGGFHDATLVNVERRESTLILTIEKIYFYDLLKYDGYGIRGADLYIYPIEYGRAWEDLRDILVDRYIHRIYFSEGGATIRLSFDCLDIAFSIRADDSGLRWLFSE